MAWWLLVGAALMLLWVVSRVRRYRKLLSDEHCLFIASRLPQLRRAALDRLDELETEHFDPATDPRVLQTPAGLVILYTVSREGAGVVHHCSVSVPAAPIAQGTLSVLLRFTLALLGLPPEKAAFGSGATQVQHAHFSFSPAEHTELAATPLELTPDRVLALRAQAVTR